MNDDRSGLPDATGFGHWMQLLTPGAIKAVNRLIAAYLDVPTARQEQKSAAIRSETTAKELVEQTIAKGVAQAVTQDSEVMARATNHLLHDAYRKQTNRDGVAKAAIESLQAQPAGADAAAPDEDWMNVFERHAEDASSEKLQELWGRVLAGEIRTAGSFTLRTLRCLSEISQKDAEEFSDFAQYVFEGVISRKRAKHWSGKGLNRLLNLEHLGLIFGVLANNGGVFLRFDTVGLYHKREGNIRISIIGDPGRKSTFPKWRAG